MSDYQKTTFKFDEDKVKQKVNEIKTFQESFKGRAGYNPYAWIFKHLTPLVSRLSEGERTEELQKSILSLEKKEPIAYQNNIDNPPREHQASGGSHNAGQSVMGGS